MPTGIGVRQGLGELGVDESLHFGEPAIQIDRTDQRLKGIGQSRGSFPAIVDLLATTEHELGPELNSRGAFGQRLLVNQPRACLGQRAFVAIGKVLVQFRADNQLQHGVPEEF